MFNTLQEFLAGLNSLGRYSVIAAELGKTKANVKIKAKHMRKHDQVKLRDLVGQTVETVSGIETVLLRLIQGLRWQS